LLRRGRFYFALTLIQTGHASEIVARLPRNFDLQNVSELVAPIFLDLCKNGQAEKILEMIPSTLDLNNCTIYYLKLLEILSVLGYAEVVVQMLPTSVRIFLLSNVSLRLIIRLAQEGYAAQVVKKLMVSTIDPYYVNQNQFMFLSELCTQGHAHEVLQKLPNSLSFESLFPELSQLCQTLCHTGEAQNLLQRFPLTITENDLVFPDSRQLIVSFVDAGLGSEILGRLDDSVLSNLNDAGAEILNYISISGKHEEVAELLRKHRVSFINLSFRSEQKLRLSLKGSYSIEKINKNEQRKKSKPEAATTKFDRKKYHKNLDAFIQLLSEIGDPKHSYQIPYQVVTTLKSIFVESPLIYSILKKQTKISIPKTIWAVIATFVKDPDLTEPQPTADGLKLLSSYGRWNLCELSEDRLLASIEANACVLLNGNLLIKPAYGKLTALCIHGFTCEGSTFLPGHWYSPIDQATIKSINDAYLNGCFSLRQNFGTWAYMRPLEEGTDLLEKARAFAAVTKSTLPGLTPDEREEMKRNIENFI